jgi:hypothetical protein
LARFFATVVDESIDAHCLNTAIGGQPVDADLVPPGACTLIALAAIALFFILAVS